jgi:hypothetical protein
MTSPVEELAINKTHDFRLSDSASAGLGELAPPSASLFRVRFSNGEGGVVFGDCIPGRRASTEIGTVEDTAGTQQNIAIAGAAFSTLVPGQS